MDKILHFEEKIKWARAFYHLEKKFLKILFFVFFEKRVFLWVGCLIRMAEKFVSPDRPENTQIDGTRRLERHIKK